MGAAVVGAAAGVGCAVVTFTAATEGAVVFSGITATVGVLVGTFSGHML